MQLARLPQHPAQHLLSAQNLPCADRGRAEAMSGECVQADNLKDNCHKAQSDEKKKFKTLRTLQFSHVLSLGLHISRIDHRLRGYLSGAPSWSRKGRHIDANVLLMKLNYDLLTDFELPLAPGPGRGRFQTPAKAPTLKYFRSKEIVGRASG